MLAAAALTALAAHADVGVMLANPTDVGVSVWTNSGHSEVYLSNICPASPIELRLCRPGEPGSVLTNYPDFHENGKYSWNVVALNVYLYGTPEPNTLLYGSWPLKNALEGFARDQSLAPVCVEPDACPTIAHAYWRDLTAETVSRDLYVFAARTTQKQDEQFITWWNAQPNVNHYRTLTDNCSNFSKSIVNHFYPGSTHRDILNDLGMMSPKAAARSFTRYAVKHPEMGFYVLHFAQQPGTVARSSTARSGTETAFHQKKYLLPAALIGDHEVAGSFFVSYFLTGRFSLAHTFRDYPAPAVSAELLDAKVATREGDAQRAASLEQQVRQRRQASSGTQQQWKAYRARFNEILTEAIAAGIVAHRGDVAKTFIRFDRESLPAVDPRQQAWLVFRTAAGERWLGVDRSNLLAPGSDRALALQLMLARVQYMLKAKDSQRETWPEFMADWAMLMKLHDAHLPEDRMAEAPTIPPPTTPPAAAPQGAAPVVATAAFR